jgi:hypothetical protein
VVARKAAAEVLASMMWNSGRCRMPVIDLCANGNRRPLSLCAANSAARPALPVAGSTRTEVFNLALRT